MSEQCQALVSGTTRFIAILGDPVAQVLSPEVYNPRLAQAGADVLLIPLHVPASAFEAVMPGLLGVANLAGLIFTVPFKQRAMAFADRILPSAQQIGTINTMRRDGDGGWTADMFDGAALAALYGSRYLVTPSSNRMGYRLEGPTLRHRGPADILSDATPIGSLQVPASGQPILLMADRQTTGGYPKIATVITADLPIAGQLAPGDWMEFHRVSRHEAVAALKQQLSRLEAGA